MSGRRVAGVVGRPIAHSLSPLIHTAWIEAAGLEAAYAPFEPADRDAFARLVQAGRDGVLRGVNVTAPFKLDALELADRVDGLARRCGAANLLLFDGGRAEARSTDGQGLIAALAEQAPGLDLAAGPVVVRGAGGAARAAALALLDAGAPQVRIVNRSPARAGELARLNTRMKAFAGDQLAEASAGAALLVNAVSGGPPPDLSGLPDGAVVMDMTYRPLRTPVLQAALDRGLGVVDGLAMLIGQARPSFEALFGVAPPAEVDVRALALKALEADG